MHVKNASRVRVNRAKINYDARAYAFRELLIHRLERECSGGVRHKLAGRLPRRRLWANVHGLAGEWAVSHRPGGQAHILPPWVASGNTHCEQIWAAEPPESDLSALARIASPRPLLRRLEVLTRRPVPPGVYSQ